MPGKPSRPPVRHTRVSAPATAGPGRGMLSTPPRRKPSRTAKLGMAQTMAKVRPRPAYTFEGIDTGPMADDLIRAFGPMQNRNSFTDWSTYNQNAGDRDYAE